MTAKLCRCGHDRETHMHYREGTDCGKCGLSCPRFAKAGGLRDWWLTLRG
jgi:hypothetical protein